MNEKLTIHLVPSSHWDREWYLSFPRSRTRLVRLMDKVLWLLKENIYPCYVLDGQSVPVEDYLTIKPQNKDLLEKFISEGRLVIGPWYTVPDTFIPCGESLLKNLQLAEEVKTKFGGKGKVAYTPDSFGINSQLPQLTEKFGYEYFYYTRGQRLTCEKDTEHFSEENFVGADGTTMLAGYDKYSLGCGLVVPYIWRNFAKLKVTEEDALRCADWVLDYQSRRTTSKNRLWICGIDHLEPRQDLPDIVRMLNEHYPNINFRIGTIDDYFNGLKEENFKPQVEAFGEQRGPYDEHFFVGNTLSSRMDIKLQNRRAENLLFSYVGGLQLFDKNHVDFDDIDAEGLLHDAYKNLVKSHAHDSICTCGSEEMCADVSTRLRWAEETAEEIFAEKLQKIGTAFQGDGKGELLVYNCLPFSRSAVVEGKTTIPYNIDGDCLVDENGKEVPNSSVEILFRKRIDIESSKYVTFEQIERDETRLKMIGDVTDADIQTGIAYRFLAKDVPPMGFARYRVAKRKTLLQDQPKQSDDSVENEFLILSAKDGKISLFDKRSGKTFENIYVPVCERDDGDTYSFADKTGAAPVFATQIDLCEKQNTADTAELGVNYRFVLQSGEVELKTVFRLERGSAKLSIISFVDNRAEDFRLRVLVSADGLRKVGSDTPFDYVERPVFNKKDLSPLQILTYPCRNLVCMRGDEDDFAIYSASFHEYESWFENGKTTAALTLMRSVERVYETVLPTKDESGAGIGTRWFSESAKMQGKFTFCYALEILPKTTVTEIFHRAQSAQLPLLVRGISPCGNSETNFDGFSLSGAVFSSVFKRDGKKFARYFNAENFPQEVTIVFDGKEHRSLLGDKKIGETELV